MREGAAAATVARLRDGTPVGAWMLKANPSVWDIGSALVEGTPLDWWRLAPGYRAGLVAPGHPCAVWVTRGDARVRSGVWAVGRVTGAPVPGSGDPDDPLWRDAAAQRQVRPRIAVDLEPLDEPVAREVLAEDPRLCGTEVLRVPRIGNPAAITPGEWAALCEWLPGDWVTPTRVV